MLTLDYQDKNIDIDAFAAINRKEPFKIIVRGWKREKLKRAVSFYRAYFDTKDKGNRTLVTWLKFGYFGFAAPTFWGICNNARLSGMEVGFYETEESLVVSFAFPPPQPAHNVPNVH